MKKTLITAGVVTTVWPIQIVQDLPALGEVEFVQQTTLAQQTADH